MAKYDFKPPDLLTDQEISIVLSQCDELIRWANDVKEYALDYMMKGNEIPGFKIVEGRSNRKYLDEQKVADVVTDAGYDPYEKSSFRSLP